MSDNGVKRLACGCEVRTHRDFLDRVLGTVTARGADCQKPDHQPGAVIIMPGREHARRE